MRVLVTCALGWMAGIILHGQIGGTAPVWALTVAAAAALLVLRSYGLVLAAVSLGALAATLQPEVAEPPAGEHIFAGEVARPAEPLPGGRQLVVRLDGGVTALVYDDGRVPLLPGDHVRFRGVAHRPRGFWDEGAFDRETLFAARGLDWQIAAAPPGVVATDEPPSFSIWRTAAIVRERAAAGLAASSDGDGGALLAALVLGRRGDVTPTLEDSFRRAGVAHVLSVSGLHLAAAAALFFAAARSAWLRVPRLAARFAADRAAALVALPAAAGYTLITGAEVATVRSLVCAAIVLGARALGRSGDALTALAGAALAILAWSPLALYDASFQLSFAAAGALALVAPRLPRSRILSLVLASAAATLATAPLTALHFNVVQPAGLVTNLVVVPLAEVVVLPVGLLAGALAVLSPAIAAPVVAVAGWAAAGLAWVVGFLGRFSPSLDVPPPTALELAVAGVAVVIVLRARWKVGALALLGAGATFAVVECWLGWAAPRLRDDAVITFLDVGQGDGAVIEAPRGQTWLVDAGGRLFDDAALPTSDPGEQATLRFLVARRIRKLDVVVVSHPHPDHFGGLVAVTAHIPVGELWISGDDPHDPRWTALVADLAAHGTRILQAVPGTTRTAGAARLDALGAAADPDRSVNDNSLVVALGVGGRRVLFPGDLEAAGETALVEAGPVQADVVKVPHHGSKTSSSATFVDATHPALAVVSCGARNHFGFPAPRVIAAWTAAGATVLRTDQRGAITVTLTPAGRLAWHTRR